MAGNKVCESCTRVYPPGLDACPHCGSTDSHMLGKHEDWDPSEHSPDEVNARLVQMTRQERYTVLRRERLGKARKDVLDQWGDEGTRTVTGKGHAELLAKGGVLRVASDEPEN